MKKIILTCEHAGNKIPASYKHLFKNFKSVLKTHRGLDIGALTIAKDLQKILKTTLHFSETTRLLIDLNRFRRSKSLFSEVVAELPIAEKQKIIKNYYEPHWTKIDSIFSRVHQQGSQIVHVAVHSMTDNLNGKLRPMQLALLYDPKRPSEKKFSDLWILELKKQFPNYKIARNNPYKGTSEGVTCFYRKRYLDKFYIGIELEMNQGLLKSFTARERKQFSMQLAASLKNAAEKI